MTVAIEAFKAYQERLKQVTSNTRDQYRAQIEVGRKLQMVVDHPGWQTYLEHLTAIKDNVQVRRNKLVNDMSNTDALGEALTKLKLQCVSLDGELKGLSAAIDMIPTMIQRAQDAVKLMDRANDAQAAAE